MISRALRALRAANHRVEDWFDDLTLRTRRITAAGVVLAIFVGTMIISAVGQADFERAGELVRTEERHHAVIVGHRPEGRSGTTPLVWTGGEERDLDYGWFLESDDEGTRVQYVVDPADPSHLIAVGEPSDWERPLIEDNLITVVIALVSLIAGGLAAMRIVPEDLDTAFTWFHSRRKPGPRRRRRGGRH